MQDVSWVQGQKNTGGAKILGHGRQLLAHDSPSRICAWHGPLNRLQEAEDGLHGCSNVIGTQRLGDRAFPGKRDNEWPAQHRSK